MSPYSKNFSMPDPLNDAGEQKLDKRKQRLLKILLPAAILIIGILVAIWMMETKPKAKTRPKARNAALVEVQPVTYGQQSIQVNAMGLVKPDRIIEIRPQVSGEIIKLSEKFQPGGKLNRGELLVEIDPSDYELSVRQSESAVARAAAELQMEQGNQLIAVKELELLGQQVSPEEKQLMLRQPQLESSKAAYATALASLEQAKLNLQRTRITVPFNCVIETQQVNLGTRVSPSTPLATLVGTDDYRVELSVPASQLKWIRIPQSGDTNGSPVRVFDTTAWGKEAFRTGVVIGMGASVEENGRMARLLVSIPDPLALKKEYRGHPVVLLGSYLQVAIEGKPLDYVAAIARQHLRDSDAVWIMDENSKLDIRPVEIVFRDQDRVYVAGGLTAGERLVISSLPAPVQGMLLRLEESESNPATDEGSKQ